MSILSNLRTLAHSNVETPFSAFARHEARIRAITQDQLIDLKQTPIVAVRTVNFARARYMTLRPDMDMFKPKVDLTLVDDCPSIANAFWYAASNCVDASANADERKQLYSQGIRTRDLFENQRGVMQKAEIVVATGLQPMTATVGAANVGSDIMRHVRFYRAHWDVLKGVIPITEEDLTGAEVLAARLNSPDINAETLINVGEEQFVMKQAATLLMMSWSAVRRCVSFIRWEEGDLEEFAPSFYLGRTIAKGKDEEEVPATPPASEPPAAVGAPSSTPATPAATPEIPVGFRGSNPFTNG